MAKAFATDDGLWIVYVLCIVYARRRANIVACTSMHDASIIRLSFQYIHSRGYTQHIYIYFAVDSATAFLAAA